MFEWVLNIPLRYGLKGTRHYEFPKMPSFLLIGVHSMQDWTATARHGVTRKRSTKELQHTGNPLRKNLQLKDVF